MKSETGVCAPNCREGLLKVASGRLAKWKMSSREDAFLQGRGTWRKGEGEVIQTAGTPSAPHLIHPISHHRALEPFRADFSRLWVKRSSNSRRERQEER